MEFSSDINRVGKEKLNEETPAVLKIRQFFEALLGRLFKINTSFLALHIMHSEGGLIFSKGYEKINSEIQGILQETFTNLRIRTCRAAIKKNGIKSY